jgi:hypothetical protein
MEHIVVQFDGCERRMMLAEAAHYDEGNEDVVDR